MGGLKIEGPLYAWVLTSVKFLANHIAEMVTCQQGKI